MDYLKLLQQNFRPPSRQAYLFNFSERPVLAAAPHPLDLAMLMKAACRAIKTPVRSPTIPTRGRASAAACVSWRKTRL